MRIFCYLIILHLCTDLFAQANQVKSAYSKGEATFESYLSTFSESDYGKSLKFYNVVIDLCKKEKINSMLLADSYHKRGILFHIQGEFTKALEEYHRAVLVKKEISQGAKDSIYFKELVLIGNIHHLVENYDSAEFYYNEASDIERRFDKIYERKRLFNSLGVFYSSLGNYYQALNHYNKAIKALEISDPDYLSDKLRFQNNIAFAQTKLGNHKEAITIYQQLLNDQNNALLLLYESIGGAYLQEGQYDSAEFFLEKSLNQRDVLGQLNTLNSLGALYNQKQQTNLAQDYLKQSIKTNHQNLLYKNRYLSDAYRELARVVENRNKYDSALHYYQQALITNTFDFDSEDITQNPGEKYQPISVLYQSQILQDKGNAFVKYYGQNQDTTNLLHALNCFQEAIRVARYTQKTYDNEEAKLFFVNQVHSLYEDAIRTAYHLYQISGDNSYAELALQFSEKSKASVLTEILREVDIKTSGEVNDSLVSEEKLIKQQVTANRLKLVESSDSAQNEEYRQKINDLEIALARTIKQLQQDEKYYQLKYQEDTIDLAAWQSQLLNDEDLLLEYFMGEEQLYVFAIEQNALAMHQVTLDTAFRDTWKNVQNHLFAYDYGDKFQNQWSVQLYKKLIEPVAESLAQKKRLIVIPAGELSYLPFEMLAKDTQEDKFLLHDYTISYAFSGTLLYNAHLRETAQAKNQEVLAMAPFAGRNVGSVRDNSLSPLYFSRQEVASVGGSLYLEEEATKQLFLEIAGSYNILHLATHASVNDENPLQSFIAFYPEDKQSIVGHRLYTHELYNLRLDSVNLVVLSSCDAGNGRLVKGEGIISLARAFAYAGCPNIVTTLWKADDKAASDIASQMHYYLKKGYTKDEALRQAKLDYLRDPETKELRTPYYWANFVFIGDPAPIYRNYSWVWWLVAGLAVVLIAGAVITIKRRIRSSRQTA